MGIDYSREKVQSSLEGSGQAKRETIKHVDNLDKQYKYTITKMLKTNARVRELEMQNQDMQFNLFMLPEESKRFLKWKYGEGKSVEWIATEMFGRGRATVYRKIEELVEDINHWSNFV